MKKFRLFIFVLFLISQNILGQSDFKLISSHKNSDINYLTIKNINSLNHGYREMIKNFKPVKGQFDVYVFIKEFKGTSKEFIDSNNPDTLVTFHDLIILKTNRNNQIVDGFYYRLEWAEIPSQSILFRSFCDSIELTDKLLVRELNFLNEYEMYCNLEFLENEGLNEYGQRILKHIELDKLKL